MRLRHAVQACDDERANVNVEAGVAVITLGAAVIGWFVRTERRFGKCLTREEHEKICQERNERVERKLESIETGVTGTHKRIDDLYRDLMRERGGR